MTNQTLGLEEWVMARIRRIEQHPFSAVMAALLMAAALLCFAPQPSSAEFSKAVSISGGSPAPRLSASLATAGYTGTSQMDELTLCVPSTNVNTLYLGNDANVTATTGFGLAPGTCVTYRTGQRAVDASAFFTYEATTESIAVTLRQR